MARINTLTTPIQRLPYSKKTKKWRIDNVDSADKHSFYHNESVRKSLKNKVINLNLYNGIVDIRDLTQTVNPYQLDASFIPDNIPHHPIAVPKIDLLVGEEIKRRFDWSIGVVNPNAITKKEEDKKAALVQKLQEFIESNYKEEELEKKLAEVEDYMKYTWQDIREKMANQIMRYFWDEQEFELKFNQGFKDALIMAEEIYHIDIIHDEPILEKLNPLKVHAIRSGNSDRVEDSSIIIVEDHWSPGRIVDYFHDELKPDDIDHIMEYTTTKTSGRYSDDDSNHTLLRDNVNGIMSDGFDTIFNIAEINGHYFSSDFTDENGNIRVLRVYWRSLKKIQKVKYYDEFGETQYKIRSEDYIIDKQMGEESTTLWVNEWWEGTKIGKEIYINMRPRPLQFNKLNNPSYCHPGIIGQIYNTNQGKAVSLLDRCKNYQYMYDVIWDRLNKAISTNYGKIFELDLAKVPQGWEIEKWMHFAVVNKIAVVDSFKEGNQGAATGKLAGSFNTQGGRSVDMETGNYIQQHVQLLEFIKMEMGEIAGVSKQREGSIHQNETAGGVERSVNQSAHITEFWFYMHEKLKLRVMTAFLEAAKIALKGSNKKTQHILDDQTIQMLNMDGEVFAEADYGVFATASSKAVELEQAMKQYAQAFMQNGGSFATIMDIYFSPSLQDMRRKIELSEEKTQAQQAKSAEDQNKLMQQAQADAKELEDKKLQLEDISNVRDNETRRYVAELQAQVQTMNAEVTDSDGIQDLDVEKLNLDRDKLKKDFEAKMRALDQDMLKHKDNIKVKEKQISAQKKRAASSK